MTGRWLAALVIFALGVMPARGAETAVGRFERELQAGRFPAALEIARQSKSQREHDAMLALLALHQQQAGDASAANHSAAEIYDAPTQKQLADYMRRRAAGALGGAARADFDSLIELITTTIAPNSWDEVGGPGAVDSFAGGVYVDAQGTLKPLIRVARDTSFDALRDALPAEQHEVRRPSRLRKISLPKLERELARLKADNKPPTEAMQVLAGLQRVQYVFVYPATGDLVLAGPAGDWRRDGEQRLVSTATGLPVVRLDDLVVVGRHLLATPDARFGCSITPTQESLARTRAFVAESNKKPLRPGQRTAWLEELRGTLGPQMIDVSGLDPRTRAARIMVEADYRMKLVGMGLEEGVLGVESYLESLDVPRGQAPPPLDVLRWWFTLNYDAVRATPTRQGFEIRGQGVRVLSENEMLTARGERVHTGASEALNQQFAHSFTAKFPALCQKYPIYAELRNLFDLALFAALLRAEKLPEAAKWNAALFHDPEFYRVEMGPAAKQVETVINHRVVNQIHIVAGVSGGVSAAPGPLVAREAIEVDRYGLLETERAAAGKTAAERWWWD